MTARAPPLAKKVLKLPLALPAGDALSVLGVHLQNFPVYYAYKNFHRPGGAGAPTAPPGYAADSWTLLKMLMQTAASSDGKRVARYRAMFGKIARHHCQSAVLLLADALGPFDCRNRLYCTVPSELSAPWTTCLSSSHIAPFIKITQKVLAMLQITALLLPQPKRLRNARTYAVCPFYVCLSVCLSVSNFTYFMTYFCAPISSVVSRVWYQVTKRTADSLSVVSYAPAAQRAVQALQQDSHGWARTADRPRTS